MTEILEVRVILEVLMVKVLELTMGRPRIKKSRKLTAPKMPKKSKESKKQKISDTCQMPKIPKSKLHETLKV